MPKTHAFVKELLNGREVYNGTSGEDEAKSNGGRPSVRSGGSDATVGITPDAQPVGPAAGVEGDYPYEANGRDDYLKLTPAQLARYEAHKAKHGIALTKATAHLTPLTAAPMPRLVSKAGSDSQVGFTAQEVSDLVEEHLQESGRRPVVRLKDSVADFPFKLPANAYGALVDGEIRLNISALKTRDDVIETLRHNAPPACYLRAREVHMFVSPQGGSLHHVRLQ